MSSFKLYLVFIFILYFLTFFLVKTIFDILSDGQIDTLVVFSTGLVGSFIFTLFYGVVMYFEYKPIMKYLTSDKLNEFPKDLSVQALNCPLKEMIIDFDKVQQKVKTKYVVDYLDVERQLIKFHTKLKVISLPIGCVVQIANNELIIESFLFLRTNSKSAAKKAAAFNNQILSQLINL